MAIEFKLPEVSEGVESADVAAIRVKEGDQIESGQIVMELETEKAVVDLPCPHAGRVGKILVSPGESVKVGATLMTIEGASAGAQSQPMAETRREPAQQVAQVPAHGEDPRKETQTAAPPQTAAPAAAQAREERTPQQATTPTGPERAEASHRVSEAANREDGDRQRPPAPAGPATRRLARQLGIDLHGVQGSGAGGRITEEDVQKHVRGITTGLTRTAVHELPEPVGPSELPDFTKHGPVERQKLSKIARTTATNLSLAWRTIPHVTQHDLADITDLEAARKQFMATLGKGGPKITMTAIILKAAVAALKAFPHFNSSIDMNTGELVLKRYYHLGVAVDTENGLLVPVLRDCDKKSIVEIAAGLAGIAERARDRKLAPDEMQGATFTITNLGGIGGTYFTPIVNHPEVAILGMSRAVRQLQLIDGQVTERLMLPLSLSYDHRVINGADAARFIVKLSHTLSDFLQLIMSI